MQDQFICTLNQLTPTKKEIKKASPEQLFEYIEKVFELCNKEAISIKKQEETSQDGRTKMLLELEIIYGKWSHDFNRVIRQSIKEIELFGTPKMKNLCTRLNLLLLIWTKNTRFFQNTIGTRPVQIDVIIKSAHEKNEAVTLFNEMGKVIFNEPK